MNKYKIIEKLEKFAPPVNAETWDCVGFMTETKNTQIHKIMLCLTPTYDVIKQAITQNCDMIISHHPIFSINLYPELVSADFKPLLDIYSAHTNLDIANGGTTDTIIDNIDFDTEYTKETSDDGFVRYINLKTPITVEKFEKALRKISPNLRYINNNNLKTIQKIGFCAGSGSEFIEQATMNNADCFVTGDIKFHTALDTTIVVFDIGHFESEILILPTLKKIIGKEVEIVFASEKSPFIY